MNAKSVSPSSVPNQDIASRARQIWEQEGCVSGHELDHWLRAERELKQELNDLEAASPSSNLRRQSKGVSADDPIAKTGLLRKPHLA